MRRIALFVMLFTVFFVFREVRADHHRVCSSHPERIIEKAEAKFRRRITFLLNNLAFRYRLGAVRGNWVIVSPARLTISPIALFKGVEKFSLKELSEGRNIGLAIFCVPLGSEIRSGIYVIHIYQKKGQWIMALKDLHGKTVIEKEVEYHPRMGRAGTGIALAGRTTGIYYRRGRPIYGVRFGADLPVGSFYAVLRLKSGKPFISNNFYLRRILEEVEAFRKRVISCLAIYKGKPLDVFIASRSDALVVASASFRKGGLISFFRIGKKTQGPFMLRYGGINSLSKRGFNTPSSFHRLSTNLNIGIFGGISGNKVTLGYAGSKLKSFSFTFSIY